MSAPDPTGTSRPDASAEPPTPDQERWFDRVVDAAIEAEFETGRREETVEEARHHVLVRMARMVGGFVLIALGIAALPLPGPGWLIIIVGLSLLPFAWAERTITLIRQKIPGVPAEGRIPPRTWAIMGTLVVVFSTVSIVWGPDLRDWVSEAWGNPDRLLS